MHLKYARRQNAETRDSSYLLCLALLNLKPMICLMCGTFNFCVNSFSYLKYRKIPLYSNAHACIARISMYRIVYCTLCGKNPWISVLHAAVIF